MKRPRPKTPRFAREVRPPLPDAWHSLRRDTAILSSIASRARAPVATAAALLLLAACASGVPAVRGGRPPAPTDSATEASLAAERARASAAGRTVAVPPFRVTGGGADSTLVPLGFAIADFLATDLARSRQLQLVERARLGELMREFSLAGNGVLDTATAPRAGQLLQARELVLGSLDTLPGGDVRVSVRLADVATGAVTQALDARAPLRDVLAAEKVLALRLFDVLGVALSPAERALVEARSSVNGDALLAYGRGVQAELEGDLPGAVLAYTRASRLDPGFQVAAERATATTRRLGTAASALMPGIRGLEAPVAGVVDRLNRPLDLITTQSRPLHGPGDPAFPTTLVTVVIVIRRP